ncbi:MAG: hypothetical protein ACO3JG_10910 [Luteolibacter sp.]
MKTNQFANLSLVLTCASMVVEVSARSPIPPAAWKISLFDLGFSRGPSGLVFGSSVLDMEDISVNPDGTFVATDVSGRWFFSDDFIYLVMGDVQPAAITRELDTMILAGSSGGGSGFVNVEFNAAIALPTEDFTRADVAGTWQLLRQTSISFSDSQFGSQGYNGVFHSHETLALNENGTFTLTEVSNTDPGDEDLGSPISGTWSVLGGRTVRLAAGGETLDIASLSAGLDTFTDFQTETFSQGSNTNFDRKVVFGVKTPTALASAELVGRWGLTGMTIEVEDDLSPTYLQELRGATFEVGDVSLLADGKGVYRRLRTNDPSLSAIENFEWLVVGSKVLVTGDDGLSFYFHVSAGKDFAVALDIENGPGDDTDSYDVLTLCRLPDAPGFAAVRSNFDFSGTPQLCIATADGLFYQLQRSKNMRDWVNVGDPVEGDGTEKCIEDADAPDAGGSAFYRWTIVAGPGD